MGKEVVRERLRLIKLKNVKDKAAMKMDLQRISRTVLTAGPRTPRARTIAG